MTLEEYGKTLNDLLIEGVTPGSHSTDHIAYAAKLLNLYTAILALLSNTTDQIVGEGELQYVREVAQLHINIAVAIRS